MKSATRLFYLCLILFSQRAVAINLAEDSQREETLCKTGEDIYFSCPLKNGKIISICAINNFSSERGYVVYRYGNKNNLFFFPKKEIAPGSRFFISDVSEGSIRGLHLKFTTGPYTYVVSSVPPGGVYVSKSGKIVFDQNCQASEYKSFSNKIFDGIKQAPISDVDLH